MALKRFKNWKGIIGSRKGVLMACVGICVALGAFFGGVDMAKADNTYLGDAIACNDQNGYALIGVKVLSDFTACYYHAGNGYYDKGTTNPPWGTALFTDPHPFYSGGTERPALHMESKDFSFTDELKCFDHKKDDILWIRMYWNTFLRNSNSRLINSSWSNNLEATLKYKNSAGTTESVVVVYNTTDYDYNVSGICGASDFTETDPNVEVTSPANNRDVTESFILWFETSDVDLDKWDVVIATVVGVDNKNFEIFRKTFWRDVNSESESFPIRMESMGVGEYTISFEFVDFSTGERFQTDTEFGWSVVSYVTGFDDDFLPFSETDQFDNFSGSGFYDNYSSYDEPTPMYSKITGLIDPVANWIGRNVQTLSQTFERDVAKNQGAKMTQGIVLVRYYSNSFNDLFGGFPLGDAFISLMFFMIIVACIRLVLAIKKMAK